MADLVRVAPDIRTLISQEEEVTEFASLYESFNPLTTINKQHFVEWFSGQDIDLIWDKSTAGSPTFAMVDAIDEGFELKQDTSGNTTIMDFNDINHYDKNGCAEIAVFRMVTNSDEICAVGLTDLGTENHFSDMKGDTSTADFFIRSGAGGTPSNTLSSISRDAIFRTHSQVLDGTDIKYKINGFLEVTKTTDIPNAALQPRLLAHNRGGSGRAIHIRFLEVFNT